MTTSALSNSQSEISNELNLFVDYIHSFYGVNDPLYPMVKETDGSALNRTDIFSAIYFYLRKISASTNGEFTWGEGDSLDRERVRDILLAHYGYVFAEELNK